jgi:two-component system, response regulator PdtaR
MGEPNGKQVPVPAPKAILVVEDDVLIRLAIADDLIAAGFHVIQAASADEALKVLRSIVGVDLVLTDIRMPGSFDGLGLAEQVRAGWPDLKIVVLSGDLPAVPPANLADAFLSKPYNLSAMLAVVKQLLGV